MASMTHSLKRIALLSTLLVGASACNNTLDLEVKLVTKSCDPALDPLSDGTNRATQLLFSVTGDGIDAASFQTIMNANDRALTLPEIPIASNVNIRVEAKLATGATVSVGQTGPMNLTDKEGSVPVAIFLRRTNAFTLTTGADAQTLCTQLSTPRAGHTATVLSDGRVLIAGGYHDDAESIRTYLKSVEIYDPRTGQITPGPNLNLARAFHTATHIPGTNLTVFAGGEGMVNGVVSPLGSAEVFNEEFLVFDVAPMKQARTRHAAAIPASGGLLALIGGYGPSGVLASVETFDPRKMGTGQSPFAEEALTGLPPRAEVSALGLGAGFILIAGGYNGTGLEKSTTLLRARDTGVYDVVPEWDVVLDTARALPLLAALDDNNVVVTGGFTTPPLAGVKLDASNADATNVTELIQINGGTGVSTTMSDSNLTDKRARGGIVSLGDGRVLVGGGASRSGAEVSSSGTADMLAVIETDLVGKTALDAQLADDRYQATWTLLQDGSVLVTGGMRYTSTGSPDFLRSLEVFQPAGR